MEHPVAVVEADRGDERHQVPGAGERLLPVTQEGLVLEEFDVAPDIPGDLRVEPGAGVAVSPDAVEIRLEHEVAGHAAERAVQVDVVPFRRFGAGFHGGRFAQFAFRVDRFFPAFHNAVVGGDIGEPRLR